MSPITSIQCLFAILILFLSGLVPLTGEEAGHGSGGTWLVQIDTEASGPEVAERLGAIYVGPLKGVEGYHRMRFQGTVESRKDGTAFEERVARRLEEASAVRAFEEEEWLERVPQKFVPQDPRFPEQWHWENVGQSGGVPFADIRVRPAWDAGLSGSGVTIAIVDEGTEFRHPDLIDNWLPGSGFDFNDGDSDPSPEGAEDRHGTAVAGITLAASNTVGGLGVAHRAKMVPLRLIAGRFETGDEAEALSHRKQEVDIYNNSWGPSSEGGVRYVD
ncbi:MAG TPA: S8 family serine peptidase, partial [Oceanipulchritudo sp.]|nr:S8 family serine peptidase [Oceanipulchritudo sp.]